MSIHKGSRKHALALNTFLKYIRSTNSACSDVRDHFLSELTVSQVGVLEALYHLGPLAQKELATKILKSSADITTIINNFDQNELMNLKVNPADDFAQSI